MECIQSCREYVANGSIDTDIIRKVMDQLKGFKFLIEEREDSDLM